MTSLHDDLRARFGELARVRLWLAAQVLLLVGCANEGPRIIVGSDPDPAVAAVTSPAVVRVAPPFVSMGMTVELAGPGMVQVVSEDESTVQVGWGDLTDSALAYLRVELGEGEARFEEHRVDYSAEGEARSGWTPGTVTVLPERVLAGRKKLGQDPIPPQHHLYLTLHPDGRYDATLKTTPAGISSASRPGTEEIDHLAGGPIWIPWTPRKE